MNPHDIHILTRIRNTLHVYDETDANLLSAYACWHVLAAQDWDCFIPLLNAGTRKLAWDYGVIPHTS